MKKEFNLNKHCKNIQIKIGELLMDEKFTLRDVVGILEMTKHYFLMEKWEKLK